MAEKSARSKRAGCKGVGMGHKWQCVEETKWVDEQTDMAQAAFDADHEDWEKRCDAVATADLPTWNGVAANREPTRAAVFTRQRGIPCPLYLD